ncbi:MAG TPA: sulfite exporter TauE/SafE family protein [Anaeromyxobacteraceae bacterium]|nr:sulfite exporter TauE/SafE family protein [Anaeromyxobacteraceae bacterium]
MTSLLLAAVGGAAGLLGALMGVGGGIIVVPALTQLLHLPFPHAVAASLVAVIASSSASAATYVERDLTDIRVGVVLELATVAGALAGSGAAALVPVPTLKLLFAAIAAYAAWTLWSRRHAAAEQTTGGYRVRGWIPGLSVAGVAGAISGLLGVGGGVLKVPAMTLWMGIPFKVATATSNFMIGVTAAASAYLYAARGDLDVAVVAPIVVGVFFGARVGTSLVTRLPARRLQGLFAAFLVVVALRMAWDALGGAA